MNRVWPLAVVTFKEGIRNRSLYGIALFALLMLGASQLVCTMIMRDVGKVAIDMALSTVSFCGLLIVLFVGINLMAKDFDRKTIYMVLSRPISRTCYVWGKFLGLSLLIVSTTSILSIFSFISIFTARVLYPTYFMRFSASTLIISIVYIILSLLLLSALCFFFSSFASSSFLVLILAVISWLIGQSSADLQKLLDVQSSVGISVPPFIAKLVTVVFYVFPNFALFDIKLAAAHALPLAPLSVLWVILYAVVYVVMILIVAAWIFGRREFQ